MHHGSTAGSGSKHGASTLVTLEQALAPKARPPGPVAHLVRGLCARVLQNMMEDLRKEVHRRQELAARPAGEGSRRTMLLRAHAWQRM